MARGSTDPVRLVGGRPGAGGEPGGAGARPQARGEGRQNPGAGRRERQHWARIYVQGLLLDGERKSIEPMASHIAGADVQALRQFVGQSPCAVEEVQRRLAHKVIDLLSEAEVWIIDETSFPKAGQHSVGVARQYCGSLGKIANCQVAVQLDHKYVRRPQRISPAQTPP